MEEEKGEGIPWERGRGASRPPLHTPGLRSSVCILAPGSLNDTLEQLWFALRRFTLYTATVVRIKKSNVIQLTGGFMSAVHQKSMFLSIYAKTNLKVDA